jgi:hypothetical protein
MTDWNAGLLLICTKRDVCNVPRTPAPDHEARAFFVLFPDDSSFSANWLVFQIIRQFRSPLDVSISGTPHPASRWNPLVTS